MNRGQQPQQQQQQQQQPSRPPNLQQPAGAMSNAFRNPNPYPSPYPSMGLGVNVPGVGMPGLPPPPPMQVQRNPMMGVGMGAPGLGVGVYPSVIGGVRQQQQQQQQGLFSTQRTTGTNTGFPFGMGLPLHLQHQSLQQQQPQQSSSVISPPTAVGSSSSTTTTTTAIEPSLDPNDFPALGSNSIPGPTTTTTTTTTTTSTGSATTGASISNGTSNGTSVSSQSALTTPAQSYASQAGVGTTISVLPSHNTSSSSRDFGPDDFPALGQQTTTAESSGGVNGFTTPSSSVVGSEQSRAAIGQQRPGSTNYESERKFSLKSLPPPPNPGSTSSWSNNPNQNPLSSALLTNGHHHHLQQQQPQQHSSFSSNPPPLQPPQPPQQQQQQPQPPFSNPLQPPQTAVVPPTLPLTPISQILSSPADKWGLLGLLAMIRSSDPEITMLGIGVDLSSLSLSSEGTVYQNFLTPFNSSNGEVEPEFTLPSCYNVQPATLGPQKAAAFSDETLFFMFYAHPRDVMQEVAATELWNRNWRYHKTLRLWLTKETGTSPSEKTVGGESGMFTVWDPERWEKGRRRMWVSYGELEEKHVQNNQNGSTNGNNGTTTTSGATTNTTSSSGTIPVGRFAGMGAPPPSIVQA